MEVFSIYLTTLAILISTACGEERTDDNSLSEDEGDALKNPPVSSEITINTKGFPVSIFYAGLIALAPDAEGTVLSVLIPRHNGHTPIFRAFAKDVLNSSDCPKESLGIRNFDQEVVECWWDLKGVEIRFNPPLLPPASISSPSGVEGPVPNSLEEATSLSWVTSFSNMHKEFQKVAGLPSLKTRKRIHSYLQHSPGDLRSCHLSSLKSEIYPYRFLDNQGNGEGHFQAVSDAVISRTRITQEKLTVTFHNFAGGLLSMVDLQSQAADLHIAITNLPDQDEDGPLKDHFLSFYDLSWRPLDGAKHRAPRRVSGRYSEYQPDCESEFLHLCKNGDGLSYGIALKSAFPLTGNISVQNLCARPVCPLAIMEPF